VPPRNTFFTINSENFATGGSKWGLWRPGWIYGTETEVPSSKMQRIQWFAVVLLKPILEAEGPDRWVHRPRGHAFWIFLVVEFSHTNCWIANLEQFEHTMKQVRFHTRVVRCVWHVCRVVSCVWLDWFDSPCEYRSNSPIYDNTMWILALYR
jgi:hypothetical protein